jgi:hypothetical protein
MGSYGVWIDSSVSPSEFRDWAWGGNDNNNEAIIGWISFNCKNQNWCATSSYKVMTSFTFSPPNQPPSANNLSIDDFQDTVCGITSGARVKFKWNFDDPDLGDTQSAYRLEVASDPGFSNIIIRSCDPTLTNPNARCLTQSNEFVNEPTAGYSLLNWGTPYYWRLMVWDSQDTPSTNWIVYQDNSPPPESFTTPAHSYPYPIFTPSPQNPALNVVVNFIDSSKCYDAGNNEYYCSIGNTSYLWNFDNGQTSTKKGDATTTYTTPGSKTVRLTITDNTLLPPGVCDTTRQITVGLPLPKWKEVPPFIWLRNFLAWVANIFIRF